MVLKERRTFGGGMNGRDVVKRRWKAALQAAMFNLEDDKMDLMKVLPYPTASC